MPSNGQEPPESALVCVRAQAGERLQDFDRDAAGALYRRHGALLFRGFNTDLAGFGTFAWQFCKTAVVNETPGRTALDAQRLIYSVDGGDGAFALHPELSREPWKPDLAMFACLSAPGSGGETTLCDGIALAQALPEDIRQGLIGRRLVYGSAAWPELLAFWLGDPDPTDAQLRHPPPHCPYRFERLPDGRVLRLFSRPALHRPMFADGPAFGNFLLFARFVNGRGDFPLLDDLRPVPEAWLQAIKLAADALTVTVTWQQGDVLMLDNTRFMHGRRAIRDTAKRQIATFFGYLAQTNPDPEEPARAIWRRENFVPPHPPAYLLRTRPPAQLT